jgi:hypothetical protein
VRGSIPFTDKLFFFFICFLENKFNKNVEIYDKINLSTESTIKCNDDSIFMYNLNDNTKNINNNGGYFTLLNLFKDEALDLLKKVEEKEILESSNLFLDSNKSQNRELFSSTSVDDSFVDYNVYTTDINSNKLEII